MGQQPRKSLGSSRTAGNWEHCACCRCLVGGVRQAGRCTRLTVLLHGGEPACMRQTRSHCTRGEWAGLPRTLAVRRCLAGRWWVTGGQTCLCCCTLGCGQLLGVLYSVCAQVQQQNRGPDWHRCICASRAVAAWPNRSCPGGSDVTWAGQGEQPLQSGVWPHSLTVPAFYLPAPSKGQPQAPVPQRRTTGTPIPQLLQRRTGQLGTMGTEMVKPVYR